MSEMNRKMVAKNPYQGKYKRVLCVCAGGVLRSPTTAFVLSNPPFEFNTRSAGINEEITLIPVSDVLLEWADEIVCMDEYQEKQLKARTDKPVHNFKIGDNFEYRDKGLIDMIKRRAIDVWLNKNEK